MTKYNVEGESHSQEKEMWLYTTFLEVQTKGVILWEVEKLVIDILARNQLKVDNHHNFSIKLHHISREEYAFNERQLGHNLLAINKTP